MIEYIQILVAMDDTDQTDGPGTGHLAQDLCARISANGWGACSAISRHQLFVHPAIPYTSHNSAMCFQANIRTDRLQDLIRFSSHFLEAYSAPGSDPGLCVAAKDAGFYASPLIDFGAHAKLAVLTKHDAFHLVRDLPVHLSEHGGTGQGVIGALAAVGLRLSGNDGRFRGWYHLGKAGEYLSVGQLCEFDFIEAVKSENGEFLKNDEIVHFGADKQKTVLQDAVQVLLVKPVADCCLRAARHRHWITLTKRQVKRY
ncbi:MAG: hypothetical protein KJP07_07115 [Desulfatitalea sp.]|nr:hypothetical protein [Desulfatitalea sp.]